MTHLLNCSNRYLGMKVMRLYLAVEILLLLNFSPWNGRRLNMCIGWMKKSHLSCVEKDFPWSFFHLPLGHLISSSIAGCPNITFHISMSSEDLVDYNVGYTDKVYNWQYNVYVVMTILSLSPRHVCTVQEPDVTMYV